MAIFRVEKTRDYTVMSNHHLRNKELTLKSKGLMSQFLSLPPNWDFSLAGLSSINKESVEAIRTAVLELERAGYVKRRQARDGKGKMSKIEYTIYEQPQEPDHSPANPSCNFPITANPLSASPTSENATQLKILNESNTDLSSTYQSIHPNGNEKNPFDDVIDRIDRTSATEAYREVIKDNIEYEALCMDYDAERVAEILELIVETVCSKRNAIRIGGDDHPAELVKNRFMKLGQNHIVYVIGCLGKNRTKVRNIKAYLLTTLYNAPVTMGNYYAAEVNHGLYGGDK